MAIAVVVDKSTACAPARPLPRHPGLVAHIGERPVPVVVIKNIISVIGDVQVVEAVIVVIADAHALSPSGASHSCLDGHVGKCPVAVILEEMRDRFLSLWETLQAGTIHHKNVEPAIVIVVIKRNSTTRRFEQIFILVLATKESLDVQARLLRHIDEADAYGG